MNANQKGAVAALFAMLGASSFTLDKPGRTGGLRTPSNGKSEVAHLSKKERKKRKRTHQRSKRKR